jgi:cbb3-type cytochrome oxidase subunit 1
MKRISDRFLQLAVLFALVGMALGVWMGKTEDLQLQAVHAHINLLGWVSMMIYGLFYRAVPKAAEGLLPTLHFALSVVGFLIMIPLLALYLTGAKTVGMALGVSSGLVWAGMVVFAAIVFKATWKAI